MHAARASPGSHLCAPHACMQAELQADGVGDHVFLLRLAEHTLGAPVATARRGGGAQGGGGAGPAGRAQSQRPRPRLRAPGAGAAGGSRGDASVAGVRARGAGAGGATAARTVAGGGAAWTWRSAPPPRAAWRCGGCARRWLRGLRRRSRGGWTAATGTGLSVRASRPSRAPLATLRSYIIVNVGHVAQATPPSAVCHDVAKRSFKLMRPQWSCFMCRVLVLVAAARERVCTSRHTAPTWTCPVRSGSRGISLWHGCLACASESAAHFWVPGSDAVTCELRALQNTFRPC